MRKFPPEGYEIDWPQSLIIGHTIEWPIVTITMIEGHAILKACAHCRRIRHESEFYPKKAHCKACHIFKVRQWQKKNPNKMRKYQIDYILRHYACSK